MKYTIREATPDDFEVVLALWRSLDWPTSVPDTRETLQQFYGFSRNQLLVAEADGRIVGTVIAAWNGWRGFIARLRPTRQRAAPGSRGHSQRRPNGG